MANKRVIADKEGIYCPKCGSWNSSDWANCSNCVAPLSKRSTSEIGLSNFAILVSIIAVIISLYGAYQANVTLHASIKPILDTYADDYTKEKAVILHNYGIGPAVITDIRFYNNTTESRQLDEMIYWPYDVKFDTIQHFETIKEAGVCLNRTCAPPGLLIPAFFLQ